MAWSLGKNWRKSGLGKTVARSARSLLSAGTSKLLGSGMYVGEGKYYKRKSATRKSRASSKPVPFAAYGKIAIKKRPYRGKGMYVGSGAYDSNPLASTAKAPTLFADPAAAETPAMVTLSHREYISEVYAPASGDQFATRSIALNAGLDDAFPFLHQIASAYKCYAIPQLAFTFETSLSPNAGQETSLGDIIMCVDFDPSANPPTDQQDMESRVPHVIRKKINENSRLFVERDIRLLTQAHQNLLVRVGPIKPTEQLSSYDFGKLFLTLSGVNPVFQNQIIGRLYVDYTVHLFQPRLGSGIGLTIDKDVFITSQTDALYKPRMDGASGIPYPFGNQMTGLTTYKEDPFLYKGAYNTLGCKTEWRQDTRQLRITFPAQKTGFFEIKLTYAREVGTGTAHIYLLNGQGSNPAVGLGGNVSYYRDMPQGGSTFAWHDKSIDPLAPQTVNTYGAWSCNADNTTTSVVTMHFQVRSATTVDNTVTLGLNWLVNGNNNFTLKYLRLDIVEINAIDKILGTGLDSAAARFVDVRTGMEASIA